MITPTPRKVAYSDADEKLPKALMDDPTWRAA
jgi:hypothetical protein